MLAASQVFDLLPRLGYGPYLLDHPNRSGREERHATPDSRLVFIGEGKRKGLVLPEHVFTPEGVGPVREHLDRLVLPVSGFRSGH